LLRIEGHSDEAQRLCEQGITFGKARVRDHPRDVELRIALANLEHYSTGFEKNRGRLVEALKIMRSAADSLGALARENPLLIRARENWAATLIDLSTLQSDLGQYAEAEQSARTLIDLIEALVRQVPSSPYFRIMAAYGYAVLGKARLKAGSHGEALALSRKSEAILETSDDANDLQNLACILAVASTIADPAEGPAAAERQRRDADRAVAAIRRAIALGYADSGMLKNDPDFDSLRSRPDFQALLMDLAFPTDPFAAAR
jgi:tetratricopeptide (TPR) repeat protein